MSNDNSPWPSRTDSFFAPEQEWWHNACLGWSHDQWATYSDGYLRASLVLLDHALSEGHDLDILIYPIVFNFRHYVELKLKYLIVAASDLLDMRQAFPHTHDLTNLWGTTKPLLAQVFAGQDHGELLSVSRVMRELAGADPSSEVFRYPADKHDSPHHGADRRIGLGRFRSTAQNLSAFFEGCDAAIQEYRDAKAESNADSLDGGV